jgi:hypothetical protein
MAYGVCFSRKPELLLSPILNTALTQSFHFHDVDDIWAVELFFLYTTSVSVHYILYFRATDLFSQIQVDDSPPLCTTVRCLTKRMRFDFHGGPARLRNFKLLLNCRKRTNLISLSFPLFV